MSFKEIDTSTETYSYPCCPINNCNGMLWLKNINENFSIDYECEKNKGHKGNNIYFETFNKFYFKEKEIKKCIKCKSDNFIIKCKICKNCYCFSCSKYDEHIKQNDNITFNNNKCILNKDNNNYYCIDCNIYLCGSCPKEHKRHKIKNIRELIPSKHKINEMFNRLKDYNKLITKIELWCEELTKKIENIKRRIKSKINLILKLILNYNENLMNYTYHLNFEKLYNYTKHFNNEILEKFYLSDLFKEKTKLIFDYLFPQISQPNIDYISTQIKNIFDESILHLYDINIRHLNQNYFLNYSNTNKILHLIKYEDKYNQIIEINEPGIKIEEEIGHINIENHIKQIYKIYICLKDVSKILIYECNISKNLLFKNEDEIHYEGNITIRPFIKCIELSKNGYLATISSKVVSIWIKNNDKNSGGYLRIKKIKYYHNEIKDIISLNDNYFTVSISSKILFYNKDTFSNDKKLKICSSGILDKLYLFNQYIIVTCQNGYGIVSINTKEFVQFLEYDKTYFKCINICFNEESIYSLCNIGNLIIIEYKMNDGIFEEVKYYISLNNFDFKKERSDLDIICFKSKYLYIMGYNVYKMNISEK